MRDSARYVKIVEWSDIDHCFIGSSPGLMFGGCHGDDEIEVFKELCQIVEEVIEIHKQDGTPLPPPTAGLELIHTLEDRYNLDSQAAEHPAG